MFHRVHPQHYEGSMIKPGMAEQVFRDKYARFDGSSYETWNDVAERVSEGNGSLYNDPNFTDLLKGFMKDGVIATSGRHLQHGDRHQASKSGDRFVNCATAMTSFIQFWLLMQGCGVGRSYNNNMCPINWDNMPNVRLVLDIQHPDYEYWIEPLHEAKHLYNSESEQVRWFEVADSAEGWTKVIEALETAAFQEKHRDKLFIFDFSKVRAKNTPIRGMQNRPASGPVPFIRALVDVLKVKGAGLKPFKQAAIIDHYLAQAVLSGGVRRCLAKGTKVLAACTHAQVRERCGSDDYEDFFTDVEEYSIESLQEGMEVYTPFGMKRIKEVFKQGVKEVFRVSFVDPTTQQAVLIRCTPDHKFKVVPERWLESSPWQPRDFNDESSWVEAQHLSPIYDRLIMHNGLLVREFEVYSLGEKVETYDIEVEDVHCFYAEGVLVHNSARIACKSWEDNEQDVIEFITMKAGGQHYWSANNSIMVNDTFWNDVKANKSCKARRIFDAVISAAYYDNTGEPGFINADKLHEDRTGLDSLTPESYINPLLMRKLDLHPKTLELFGKLISNLKKEKNLMIVNPCGEISLAMHGGYCTISDIVMANMPKDVNYASMVAITVAQFLLNVNKMTFLYDHEVQRTNRIGIGLTGIHEFAWNNFGFTFRDLLNEEKSQSFWDFLLKMRQNVESFVTTNDNIKNKPHTMFTIKPSGTISKIFSVTEGAHLPAYPAYIRWVQFRKDDPKVETLQRNGYLFKDVSHVIRDTVVIGFPTKNDLCDSMFQLGVPYTCAGDVTLEEQFTWIRLLEKYWLGEQYGNQVSYTAKYKPQDTSYDAFRKAIQTEQPTVKCCSVMPQVDTTAYVYQPEEEITLERYYELMKNITQDDEGLYDKSSLECAGGACPIEGDIR